MAYEVLSLGAAITANQITNVPLTHISGPVLMPALGAAPLSVGVPILIDSEFAFVVQQTASGVFSLRSRGSEGTVGAAHDILANVYGSITNDFGNPQPGTVVTIDPAEDTPIALGQDQTIVLIGANSVYNINKASAAALTLPAPNSGDNAVTVAITSNTAFAHVVTATPAGSIKDGVTAKTTATFAAVAGATLTFVSENGAWNVVALQGVTLS